MSKRLLVDVFDPPEYLGDGSIITVRIGDLRDLYNRGVVAGATGRDTAATVEVAPCPWLGDDA